MFQYDAYNGAGWTMGQLRQADQAISYFIKAFKISDKVEYKYTPQYAFYVDYGNYEKEIIKCLEKITL